ncbi:MAG: DUF6090 family protein [Jejuia sp.]
MKDYFKYAIGEIILVVIGILIALQINNWNENRKLNNAIDQTFKTIENDLVIDTTYAASIIEFYEKNQLNSQKIIKGEITEDNYKDCMECISLVTIYQPFNRQSKGITQLKNLVSSNTNKKDSLITDITKFYSVFEPLIDKSNDRMEMVVMKNFNDFEEFPWFTDMATGKFSEEFINYFTQSEDYKKRVVSHAVLGVGNHLALIKQYKANATLLLQQINERY